MDLLAASAQRLSNAANALDDLDLDLDAPLDIPPLDNNFEIAEDALATIDFNDVVNHHSPECIDGWDRRFWKGRGDVWVKWFDGNAPPPSRKKMKMRFLP